MKHRIYAERLGAGWTWTAACGFCLCVETLWATRDLAVWYLETHLRVTHGG